MKTVTLAALIAATLSAAPALAQPGPTRIAVGHADLDLTTAQGRSALDLRILRAARTACGTPSPADPRGRAELDACVAEVRAAARQAVAIAVTRRQAQGALASSR